MNSNTRLNDLRDDFIAMSAQSVPLVGAVFWTTLALLMSQLQTPHLGYIALIGSGLIFPAGLVLRQLTDRTRARPNTENPLISLLQISFLLNLVLLPLVIGASQHSNEQAIMALGGAIIPCITWISYGWLSENAEFAKHAFTRSILSYLAFFSSPVDYKTIMVCAAVATTYVYSSFRWKRL